MKNIYWLAGLILSIGISLFTSPHLFASTAPTSNLRISPLRSELQISAGTTYSGILDIANTGKIDLDVSLSAEVFSVTDVNYDYSFDAHGPSAGWVNFSTSTVTLHPGDIREIGYQVGVPINTEPGGRYISLFATTTPLADGVGITPTQRVASLLYITVPGDVTRIGKLMSLDSPFILFGSSQWTSELQNSGSTHFRSIYSVTTKSIFGQSDGTMQGSALILPSTVRLITGNMPSPKWLGIYRIDYVIGLGDTPAHYETRWVVYVPPLQVLILIILIAGIALLFMPQRHQRI